jgi:hypothetical protein
MVKFYSILLLELLFFPFLYTIEFFKKILSLFYKNDNVYRVNINKLSSQVLYVVHEWAGYAFKRKKTIKYIEKEFECGLFYQIERMNRYNGKNELKKILTISGLQEGYLNKLKCDFVLPSDLSIYPVQNTAMDFSGYSFVINKYSDNTSDQIIFLTNTSVDADVRPFIDQYVNLFRDDPTIGLVGVSYCTKVYQSFIRNNFRPHLQSFFLVSRLSVLKEVKKINGGIFPGSNENFKLSIIRFGEVKITELVQKLGYKVCVILEDGSIKLIPKSGKFYNGFFYWNLPFNDYRLSVVNPNRINPISKISI